MFLQCKPFTASAQIAKANVVSANVTGNVTDTTSAEISDNTANPDSIITFKQLDMPVEMEIEFSRLQPKGVLLFRDEFQQMHNGVYGEAIRTIKVWFIDDHIIGYTIERPFDAGTVKVIKKKINIPVTWCCTPLVQGHVQHCANTLAELRANQVANKCSGWHIKLPPPLQFQAPLKLKKIKKHKKDKAKEGDFGHTEKTGDRKKHNRKKKDKKQPGFQPANVLPASDSTEVKPVKDSI